MTVLTPVLSHNVEKVWQRFEPLVAHALVKASSIEKPYQYLLALIDGKQQLWVIGDNEGVIITEIYPTLRGLTCAMPIAAGRDDHIEPCLEVIEAWARSEGCTRMEFVGRLGWIRRLKQHAWTPISMTIEKELI